MKKIEATFQHIVFEEKYTPLLFLVLAFLGFGLLANRLGYYQDDWPYIFYAFNKGIPSLTEELYYDSRPNAAWMYISLFHLFGLNPVIWHIAAVIFRWVTATLLWYFLKRVWPEKKQLVTFAILLFIIHPFFLIQPYAVNSILYWGGYLFFAASLWIMARNAIETSYRIPLTILAVLLEALHLFTSEYFVGMVIIRPLVLYWILSKQESNIRLRVTKTLAQWFPYLIALGSYIIWRLFLFTPPPQGDRNSPVMLFALLKSPVSTLGTLIRTALQDSTIITFTSWYRTLSPELFGLGSIFSWFVLLIIGLTFAGIFIYLIKSTQDETSERSNSLVTPMMLGILLVILGMAPIWIIGQDIVTHKNQFAGSRFGIGSTFGAALIIATVIYFLINRYKNQVIAISICVALAVGMHLNNEKDFSYSWEKQERLYQQLLWRAPAIKPGTAIVTDEEIVGYMGQYALSFAIITAYQPKEIQSPPYWYFPFYYTDPNVNDFLNGIPLEDGKLSMDFKGNSHQMLLLSFNPELKRCLWILQPDDTNLRLVSGDMRRLSAGSTTSLIQKNDQQPSLPESIFGKQEDKGWCYYFEKADLARQYQEWDQITNLWKQAQKDGEQADNGFEYIPFIEGYGHQGDWDEVKLLAKSAKKITSGLEPSLCSALDRLATNTPTSEQKDSTIKGLKEDLACKNYQ